MNDLNEWLSICHSADVVLVRERVRTLGTKRGLSSVAIEALATAATEITQNLVLHAVGGEVSVQTTNDSRPALTVVARDQGPGIEDLELALRDGYSTKGSLGLGLPSARRLVDDFEIDSAQGIGTTITLRKWLPCP